MNRLLQSAWLTALAGFLLYMGTTVAVFRLQNFSVGAAKASVVRSADDDPSWRFKNPEFDQWIAQMKDEREGLAVREQQLAEWQARLDAERQEITTVTQTVAVLQADFDRNVIRFKAQEVDNVKRQVKLISAMSPAGAVTMLNEMPDDDVVRILFSMKIDEASVILETMGKLGKPEARRAATLTERLHQVLPAATNAPPTTAS